MRWSLLFAPLLAMADTAPIADENLRMAALHAIFPGMQVTLLVGKRIGEPSTKKTGPYELDGTDAFLDEKVYRVVGKATNEVEQCAAEDVGSRKFSESRLVRFRLFPWPKSDSRLAVVQYNFEDVTPAGACWSVGLLTHLESANGKWGVRGQYVFDPQHHTTLLGVRLADLTGAGASQLVVEPDWGGVGTWGSNLLIFDLEQHRFDLILKITGRVSYEIDEMYEQKLDAAASGRRHGEQFCFAKTTMVENGKPSIPRPRVTHLCYKRGEGVDQKEEAEDQRMWLKPIP